MKRQLLLSIIFFALSNLVSAQKADKLENAKTFTWYGIDFSHARFVGDFSDQQQVVDYYLNEWNMLILNESDKYNFAKAFKKKIKNDLETVTRRNSEVDPAVCFTFEPTKLAEGDLNEIVSHYSGENEIGVLFVVENFNKMENKAQLWIVIFDDDTHEVLITKHIDTLVKGFGFRNFWASSFYASVLRIERLYSLWLDNLKDSKS